MLPVVVTLSSIPPRFSGLGPTLRSLLRQSYPALEIRLYIPVRYRRFPDWDGRLPTVPDGITIIRCLSDFGPATKVLPAARDFSGLPMELLLCDDDRIYDVHWIARFMSARHHQPHSVITEDGGYVHGRQHRDGPQACLTPKDWRFRLHRLASLGLRRPPRWRRSGFVDYFKGYSGALLRPDFLPDFAFDIPEILWTVDDVWLSGCLAANGIGIWVNANCPVSRERPLAKKDPLLKFLHSGYDRHGANKACQAWFQQHKGIWRTASDKGLGKQAEIRKAGA